MIEDRLIKVLEDLADVLKDYQNKQENMQKVNKLLNDLYCSLWSNAYYDGLSEEIEKFCQPLADKMKELNNILKFKQ